MLGYGGCGMRLERLERVTLGSLEEIALARSQPRVPQMLGSAWGLGATRCTGKLITRRWDFFFLDHVLACSRQQMTGEGICGARGARLGLTSPGPPRIPVPLIAPHLQLRVFCPPDVACHCLSLPRSARRLVDLEHFPAGHGHKPPNGAIWHRG